MEPRILLALIALVVVILVVVAFYFLWNPPQKTGWMQELQKQNEVILQSSSPLPPTTGAMSSNSQQSLVTSQPSGGGAASSSSGEKVYVATPESESPVLVAQDPVVAVIPESAVVATPSDEPGTVTPTPGPAVTTNAYSEPPGTPPPPFSYLGCYKSGALWNPVKGVTPLECSNHARSRGARRFALFNPNSERGTADCSLVGSDILKNETSSNCRVRDSAGNPLGAAKVAAVYIIN